MHCKFRKTTIGATSLKHQKAHWEIGRIALPCLVLKKKTFLQHPFLFISVLERYGVDMDLR